MYNVPELIITKGNLDSLIFAANCLLSWRNQIKFSALKTRGRGGKNEAGYVGPIRNYERKFFLANNNPNRLKIIREKCLNDDDKIIYNLIMAFDHGRIASLSVAKKSEIWKQHCITIIDAYPQVCAAAKISWFKLFQLFRFASDEWHRKYPK